MLISLACDLKRKCYLVGENTGNIKLLLLRDHFSLSLFKLVKYSTVTAVCYI